MSRPRRWSPPRKQGFRCIFDSGVTAFWLRRNPDSTLTGIVWIGYSEGDRNGIWVFHARIDSPLLYSIIDKPHRVGWLMDDLEYDYWGAVLIEKRPLPQGPPRRAPKLRRGKRREIRRPTLQGWLLPRKFRIQ